MYAFLTKYLLQKRDGYRFRSKNGGYTERWKYVAEYNFFQALFMVVFNFWKYKMVDYELMALKDDAPEGFFAQYYGQNIYRYDGKLIPVNEKSFQYDGHIELKSFESMTEEHMERAFKVHMSLLRKKNQPVPASYDLEFFISGVKSRIFSMSVGDCIRSMGYALPWNGYTEDEMEERGWIKIV